MGTWYNNDGLLVKYGTNESTATPAGTFPTMVSGMHVTELILNPLTALTTTNTIQADSVVIPANAVFHKIEILAETLATSGGSATLDIGLSRLDRSTELDYDGLVAQLALTAIDTTGETTTLTKGSTGAGALIGTSNANAGLLTARYNTAAFTAGKLRVRIYWYKV